MGETNLRPQLPPDQVRYNDEFCASEFSGVAYAYRLISGEWEMTEIRLRGNAARPLEPFHYNKPIFSPDSDPTAPPTEFQRDEKPREGYHALALVTDARRAPNHLYETDDAAICVVNTGTHAAPRWELRYFPKNCLDALVWTEMVCKIRAARTSDELIVGDGFKLQLLDISMASAIHSLIQRNKAHLSQHGDVTASKYQTLEDVENSILNPAKPLRLRWAIRDFEGEIMGSINLEPDDDNPMSGEVGVYLDRAYTGHGYATKALLTLMSYAFDHLGYEVVYAKVHGDNGASSRVLGRLGFTLTSSHTGTHDGHLEEIYTMTRQEYATSDGYDE